MYGDDPPQVEDEFPDDDRFEPAIINIGLILLYIGATACAFAGFMFFDMVILVDELNSSDRIIGSGITAAFVWVVIYWGVPWFFRWISKT